MADNKPEGASASTAKPKSHIGGLAAHGGVPNVTPFEQSASKLSQDKSGADLIWAQLESQPTNIRLKTSVVEHYDEASEALTVDEKTGRFKTVDIQDIANSQELRLKAIERAGYMWLQNLRDRFDRVGIPQPSVEVRFQNLTVEAKVLMGANNLPTLPNSVISFFDGVLGMCGANLTKKEPFPVLKNVSGVVKPGRMTLLLGPPGCGKTTLLLALSGRLMGSGVKSTGSVTYNGHTFDEFEARRTASYVSQTDTHIGELTVRETFDFSARIQGAGAREKMLRELLRREKEQKVLPDPAIDAFVKASALEGTKHHIMTDYILKTLGLDVCADTIVGNEMLRGISGGQKKRVTTGEMLVGPMNVHFMDEISTGLDSSTTFEIVQSLQRYCHILETTVCMALLQPAPEVFELFDDICLLSEGHVVYFGPRERVLEFFELCGFKIPGRKGVADFLQEVTSKKDQAQYWCRKEPYRFVTVQDFVDRFAQFEVGQLTSAHLATPFAKEKSNPLALVRERYALKPMEMYKAMWDREIILARRNSFLWIFRGTMCAIVAFITAFLFLRTTLSPDNVGDGQLYLGVIFFSLLFMVFSGLSNIALTVQRLPVFTKQRDNLFYPGWAFALPTTLLELPYAVIESVVWAVIVYYIVGMAPEPAHFFVFILILICLQNMCTALFRLVGALGRSLVSANTGGTGMFAILLVCGGFVLAKQDIKPWWVWAYWISPLTYAQNALAANEFKAHRWNLPNDSNSTTGGVTLGDAVLKQRGLHTNVNWIWIGAGVLVAYYFILNAFLVLVFDRVPGFHKTVGALPEEQVIERRKGSLHEKEHTLASIAEDGEETGKSAKSNGAVAIEMGSAAAAPPSGQVRAPDAVAIDVAPNPRPLQQPRTSAEYTTSFRRSFSSAQRSLGTAQRSLGQPHHSGLDYRNSFLSADGERKKGMVLPFDPLVMTFHDVSYSVDMPADMRTNVGAEKGAKLQLLHNVSGAFRPGVLTALMGVSGAGKTTLMDVLAGRKTGGYIEGDVRISGHPKVHETFARVSGYVEQFDIHSPQATVREALIYSAWLRLPEEVDKQTRELFVDEVMELVELTTLRDALVGLPGISGLSVEQRKRLTIAVELVANPSIIFMDEPTSGLDARAAAIVMRAVRNTVNTGRTVVCTIHQPSIDIFESFDELLLLKRGGHVTYFGPLGRDSALLVEYFRKIDGVPPIKEGYNPSTWMLEVSTPAMEEKVGDFAEHFKKSALFQQAEELIAEEAQPAEGSVPLAFDHVYARSWAVQFQALLWKFSKTYWRFPEYNAIRYLLTLMLSLLIGTNFLNLGSKRETQQDVLNVMGALFISVIQLGVNNAQNVQPVIAIERAVSYRERPAGMYAPLPYALAAGVVEIPYCLTQTALYTLIVYSLINFIWTAAKFWWFFLFMFQTLFLFTYYGIMSIAITPNVQIAQVTSILFYFLWCLFCGFLIPQPAMPGWVVWLYYINPMAWSLYGVVGSQLGDITDETISYADGTVVTIKDFTQDFFGFKHELLGMVVGIMFGMTVIFFFVATWALRYLNFQNR